MARHLRFDAQDRAALRAFNSDFTISADGKRAVISGEMEIVVVRPANGDRYWLRFEFPNGEELNLKIPRWRLLQDIEADES